MGEPKPPEANKSVVPVACPWINVSCLYAWSMPLLARTSLNVGCSTPYAACAGYSGGTADRPAATDGDEILSSESLLPRWQARVAAVLLASEPRRCHLNPQLWSALQIACNKIVDTT